jgi:hypothetical protein
VCTDSPKGQARTPYASGVDTHLDVHIGSRPPAWWDDHESYEPGRPRLPRAVRPRIAAEDIAWDDLGLRPRWVGEDTSTAVAAIEAAPWAGAGADEWRRFHAGVAARGELALHISTCKPPGDEPSPVSFGRSVSINFPYLIGHDFHIHAEPLPLARLPELADGLSATDKDLALRILNERSTDREWLAFEPKVPEPINGSPWERRPAGRFFGMWTPLLQTPDGRTVAGVWSDDEELDCAVRHYVLPDLDSYRPILAWLVERAVPDLVPAAAARTRGHLDLDPLLQSDRESTLTGRLTELTAQYEAAKADLEAQLADARAEASPVRDALLYGTGPVLESAVARVLADAGLRVEPLDRALGTKSADLLVEYADHRVLVEVKSSGGPAPEKFVDAVRRHCQTWPELRPDERLTGVVLVVNHQHKQPPAQRHESVYQRREFVDSLELPVISTREVLDAWRHRDWARVREAVGVESSVPRIDLATAESTPVEGGVKRSWWRRG